MCVQVTLPASIYAAKQHVLTYYMQRDGIVKSVEGLIQQARHAAGGSFAAKKWGRNMRRWLTALAAILLSLSAGLFWSAPALAVAVVT